MRDYMRYTRQDHRGYYDGYEEFRLGFSWAVGFLCGVLLMHIILCIALCSQGTPTKTT